MGLMTSMFTGVSGLKVNQTGLNATGHNLANVDTAGYVRQQVLSKDFNYNSIGSSNISTFQVGLGTDMASIRQVRDVFLDKSFRLEVGRMGFYQSQYEAVNEVENLMGEMEGVAFQDTLSDFWSTMQELAIEPGDTAKRKLFIEGGINFLERAESVYKQLSNYQETLNKQIMSQVDRVNEIGSQIHDLNKIIQKNESSGQSANDYRDARNQLLDELGGLVNISYSEDVNGIVTVNLEGNQFVTQDSVNKLDVTKTSDQSEMLKVVWASGGRDVFNLNSAYSMDKNTDIGSLKGLLVARGDEKANYTDIPIREDFANDTAYNKAVKEFNNKINPSVIMSIQAQFDQLVHGVTTAINDILSPNADVDSLLKGLDLLVDPAVPQTITDAANGKIYTVSGNTTNVETQMGTLSTDADGNEYFTDKKGNVYTIDETDPANIKVTITEANGKVIKSGISAARNGDEITFTKDGVTYTADTVAGTAKSDETIDSKDFLVWDEGKSPVGMDDDKTAREALFNRKNTERYTEAQMSYVDENGDTQTRTVYIYNQEDPEDNYTLFTIGEIEVNAVIKEDCTKIPLSGNKSQGIGDAYDIKVCEKLLAAWQGAFAKLDPNAPAKSNFMEYYNAMIGSVSNKGKVLDGIAEHQRGMVSEIDSSRQGLMGVSSEEELTNMIKFQHGYNANAKYISAIDEMLQHILERLG